MNRLPTIISTSARSPRLLHTTTMGSSSRVQLVSPQEVQAQGLGKYRVLDSSFHLPNSGRSALDDFRRGPRLPGARLFDHDLVADRSYTLPNSPVKLGHMLPDIHTFKLHAQLLGIARNDHLLLYDSLGLFSAPRAAWLFNAYGHPNISVLDGGLPRWIHEKCPVETGAPSPPPEPSEYVLSGFPEAHAREKVVSYDAIVQNFTKTPTEDELPAMGETYRRLLGPEDCQKVFLNALDNHAPTWELLINGQKKVVVSCGSGLSACILWLALHLYHPNAIVLLYDESWTGYALRNDAPIISLSA
ncbi:hypothetical protein VP01_4445g1 [Puccinia sorghi]|uniref:Rhodanese domain-containing protein n=1 Tax=Puccinia sorghi TaxID=27349 RepID=A0A0L6UPE5_9BASI|nr:hypothetical protein VP01_4445g1 [Puccinia sorghi]